MLNIDQLPLYPVSLLPELFSLDSECKFLALKIKLEASKTALHAVYIEKQAPIENGNYCALVTVSEWSNQSDKEEFFIEADTVERLLEKLQRFDEINNFIFMKIPNSLNIEIMSMEPQALLCMLFPELGGYDNKGSSQSLLALKHETLILLKGLDK
jgi:hypothetical protein